MSLKLSLRKLAYTRKLIATFVLMMFLSALSTVSVRASPITITVSPPSAPVGSTVTISGTGATPNGEVRIYVVPFPGFGCFLCNNMGQCNWRLFNQFNRTICSFWHI